MMSGEPPTLTWWGCAAFELRVERDEDSVAFRSVRQARPAALRLHLLLPRALRPLPRADTAPALRGPVVSAARGQPLVPARLAPEVTDLGRPATHRWRLPGGRRTYCPLSAVRQGPRRSRGPARPRWTWAAGARRASRAARIPASTSTAGPITTPYPNMGYVLTDTTYGNRHLSPRRSVGRLPGHGRATRAGGHHALPDQQAAGCGGSRRGPDPPPHSHPYALPAPGILPPSLSRSIRRRGPSRWWTRSPALASPALRTRPTSATSARSSVAIGTPRRPIPPPRSPSSRR